MTHINLQDFGVQDNILRSEIYHGNTVLNFSRNLASYEINRHFENRLVSLYMLLQDTLYKVESTISKDIKCMLVTFRVTDPDLHKILFILDHSKSRNNTPLARITIKNVSSSQARPSRA